MRGPRPEPPRHIHAHPGQTTAPKPHQPERSPWLVKTHRPHPPGKAFPEPVPGSRPHVHLDRRALRLPPRLVTVCTSPGHCKPASQRMVTAGTQWVQACTSPRHLARGSPLSYPRTDSRAEPCNGVPREWWSGHSTSQSAKAITSKSNTGLSGPEELRRAGERGTAAGASCHAVPLKAHAPPGAPPLPAQPASENHYSHFSKDSHKTTRQQLCPAAKPDPHTGPVPGPRSTQPWRGGGLVSDTQDICGLPSPH